MCNPISASHMFRLYARRRGCTGRPTSALRKTQRHESLSLHPLLATKVELGWATATERSSRKADSEASARGGQRRSCNTQPIAVQFHPYSSSEINAQLAAQFAASISHVTLIEGLIE
jgi:hypothetical protein